jgi:hypothetical protein
MAIILNGFCETRFNYAELDPDIASEAKDAAGRIRIIWRNTTAGVIEVGERLSAIKDRLPHGQFTPWLAAEFEMSDRAARLYMNAAAWAAGKTEIVSVLQPTTIYALAAPSTPDTVKVGVLERLKNGEAVTDPEVKQLIAQAKAEKKQTDETKARYEAEAKFTDPVTGKPEANVWLVEPIKTDDKPDAPAVEVENDPLATAIHAVEMLSTNDRAAFDRWYHHAHQVAPGPEAIDGDVVVCDDPNQLTLAPEHASEHDAVDVEDDPLIAMWRNLKVNPQKWGRIWVLDGAPAEVSSSEHFRVTESLAPWRDAYRHAPPERRETIRRWLEQQQP